MVDWYSPRGPGWTSGGEFNSGSGLSLASSDISHTGSRSAELNLATGAGGVRLYRWRELRENRRTTQSVWLYIPQNYKLLAAPYKWWNVMQWVSRAPNGQVQPFWHLDVQNEPDGSMRLDLVWWQRQVEGPRAGESGYQRFTQSTAEVPVGKWFQIKSELRESKDFNGALKVWQDGQLLYSMTDVRTSWENCSYNAWCASNEWSVNNYSAGLSPSPTTIYADDARITVGGR